MPAKSEAQQQAAGMAYAAKVKGSIPMSKLRGAAKQMAKMPAKSLKHFAKTKHEDIPAKKGERVVKPPYTKTLKPAERAEAMKMGAVIALMNRGITPSMLKQAGIADAVSNFMTGSGKMLLAASVLTGVPLGVLWHTLGRGVSSKQRKERELKEKIKFYQHAGQQLEEGLAPAV